MPKKNPKVAPRFWDQSQLQVFVISEHESLIQEMAKGLEKDEVITWFGLLYEELPDYDKWFFDVTFARGRLNQKHHAVNKLIESMSSKTALQSSLAYLTRFGNENWKSPDAVDKVAKGVRIVVDTE